MYFSCFVFSHTLEFSTAEDSIGSFSCEGHQTQASNETKKMKEILARNKFLFSRLRWLIFSLLHKIRERNGVEIGVVDVVHGVQTK